MPSKSSNDGSGESSTEGCLLTRLYREQSGKNFLKTFSNFSHILHISVVNVQNSQSFVVQLLIQLSPLISMPGCNSLFKRDACLDISFTRVLFKNFEKLMLEGRDLRG